ncbi:MAG: hypothetical protein IH820_10290 [Bacteroidetes bacterium]|nr:hypothetical protein [Bacteroidota bacterium]
MNVRAPIQTAFLLLFCATLTLTHERAEAQTRHSFFAEVNDGDLHYRWTDGDDLLEVRIEGDVAFTEDDAAVERISRGGYLKIEEKKGGTKRTLEVRPASDGTVRYTYKVDGRQRAYDATTRDEVADLILTIIRNTGIDADRRVARILEREGVDGVFEEIDHIESSFGRRRYFMALLEQGKLNTAQLQRLAREVSQQIDSSGDRARFLREAAPYYLENSQVYAAYFDAINTIASSGDHARVLLALLRENQLDQASLLAVLESAKGISSSGDKTRVLVGVAPLVASDDDLVAAYLDAAETISSSGDHSRALSALVRQN